MIEQALELLKAIEWNNRVFGGHCPFCGHSKTEGHFEGCRFHKALSLLESAKAGPKYPGCHDVGDLYEDTKAEQPDGEFTKEVRPRFEVYKKERPTIRSFGNSWLDKVLDEALCVVFEACRRLDVLDKRNRELEQLYAAHSKNAHETADENEQLRGRFDAQQQEIEKLKSENNRFREEDGWKDIVHCQTNAIIAKDKEIDRLTAENKVLTERIAELDKRPDFTKGGHDVSKFYPDTGFVCDD